MRSVIFNSFIDCIFHLLFDNLWVRKTLTSTQFLPANIRIIEFDLVPKVINFQPLTWPLNRLLIFHLRRPTCNFWLELLSNIRLLISDHYFWLIFAIFEILTDLLTRLLKYSLWFLILDHWLDFRPKAAKFQPLTQLLSQSLIFDLGSWNFDLWPLTFDLWLLIFDRVEFNF